MSSQLSGFEALFFGRIDYQDRALRQNQSNLEHIWRGSPSVGSSGQTWTDVIPGYGPPGGMCWDQAGCGSTAPWQDDPTLEEYNVPAYVNFTVTTARNWAQNYLKESDGTVHIMWTMGSDFQYVNAQHWYKNLDRMIAYTNVNTSTHGVNVFYSHPSAYAEAKLAAADLTWTVKTDDYFPYCDASTSPTHPRSHFT
jgi:lysosomal alpha-mannosidase